MKVLKAIDVYIMYQKIKNWVALNENKLKSQNKDDDVEK